MSQVEIDPLDFLDTDAEIAAIESAEGGQDRMRRARAWARSALYDGDEVSVRTLRLEAGFSQAQLAAAMGTQQSVVSRWEAGSGNPTASTIKKLAAVLGVKASVVWQAVEAMSE